MQSVNTDSQWSKQETCFTHATPVWLAVNHNTSVTSSEWTQCSKRIARATELGSCQSNFLLFMRLWLLQNSKDSLKACYENVNINKSNLFYHFWRGSPMEYSCEVWLKLTRALTRILKTRVQDSHLAKSRSPTGKSGSPTSKKLESHQFVHTVYLFHFIRKWYIWIIFRSTDFNPISINGLFLLNKTKYFGIFFHVTWTHIFLFGLMKIKRLNCQ